MTLPDESGIQALKTYPNQRFDDPFANDIGFLSYKNTVALLSLLVQNHTGVEKGTVLSGYSVIPDGSLSLQVSSGAAVGFTGSYIAQDNTWGFSAGTGTFACVMGEPMDVNLASGDADDRIDIIQVRPESELQYTQLMTFVSPITGYETQQALETRRNFDAKPELKKGTPGTSPTAPATDAGWVKIAEVFVPAGITDSANATVTLAARHAEWTNESTLFNYAQYAPNSWLGRRTDFPTNPFAGDECYRTDIGSFFKFDGEEWHGLQLPTVHTSTSAPTASDGEDGDLWFVYQA